MMADESTNRPMLGGCIGLVVTAILVGGAVWFGVTLLGGDDEQNDAAPTATTGAPQATTGAPQATTGAPQATTGAPQATTDSEVCEQITSLQVAPEQGSGYDRGQFGDYDRDALLAESEAEHGDYYSAFDDVHHTDAGDVHADHVVALSEAWASGAHTWDEPRLEEFAADPVNLTLLTAEVNMSKSDQDPAEWLPPHEPAIDAFISSWVAVKADYGLTVDPAERDALIDLAGC